MQRLLFKGGLSGRLVCKYFNDSWKYAAKSLIKQPIFYEKDIIFTKIKWFMKMLEYGIVGTPSQQLWMLEAVLRKYDDLTEHWVQLIKSYLQLSHPEIDIAGTFEGIAVIPYAAKHFTSRAIELLLQQGLFNFNETDETGKTGLMWAVGKNNITTFTLFLHHPEVNVNAVNKMRGSTALMMAVKYQSKTSRPPARLWHTDMIRLLLQRPDIDVNHKNGINETALMRAYRISIA